MEEWAGYPYFTQLEMRCKCRKCVGVPTNNFMFSLVSLRRKMDFPFIISSGYRCPEHNLAVGGTKNGPHTHGEAADILVYGDRAWKIIEAAREHGFTGIGVSQSQKTPTKSRYLHLDTMLGGTFNRPTLWSY